MRWGVCRERQHESQDHEHVAVKQAVGKELARCGNNEYHQCGESGAEQDDLTHDGSCALTDCAAVGQRPTEFLLEGQKEAGREGEGGEPQGGDRLEFLIAANCSDTNFEEGVRCKARDEEGNANGNRAFG